MALEADRYFDRRRLKRRLSFWRVVGVVAVATAIIIAFGRFGASNRSSAIATLDVTSVIFDDSERSEALRNLADNEDIKALIIRINSPGGTVVGGEALYAAVRAVAAKKPVITVMGQVAASAGYMVALAGDHILAREGTITGSIGVILQATEVTGLLEKIGISTEAIKSGPLKASPSPLERMTPNARKVTQSLVDDIHRMFVDMFAERRALDRDRAVALADGRVYTGRKAVANKLIDGIGGETEAVAWLENQKKISHGLPVRDVKVRREMDELLGYLESLGRKTVFSERLTLDGLISVWHPQLR